MIAWPISLFQDPRLFQTNTAYRYMKQKCNTYVHMNWHNNNSSNQVLVQPHVYKINKVHLHTSNSSTFFSSFWFTRLLYYYIGVFEANINQTLILKFCCCSLWNLLEPEAINVDDDEVEFG